jgi:hypothetical protein
MSGAHLSAGPAVRAPRAEAKYLIGGEAAKARPASVDSPVIAP